MEDITPILTLRERAASALEIISSYLGAFNGDGILVFFESDNNKNKYFERYSSFALKLNDTLSLLESSIASVSRLIAEYEAQKTSEEVAELCSLFEYCDTFLGDVAKFIDGNENNFRHDDTFNPAHTLKSARELKTAALIFNEKING